MFCPNCGNNIDDNSSFCSVCGYSLSNNVQPQYNMANQQQGVYQQQNMNYNQPAYTPGANMNNNYNAPSGQPPKKQNTGLIIGLIIGAVVLIAAIVAFLVLVVFKDDKNDDNNTTEPAKPNTEITGNLSDDDDDDIDDVDDADIALGTYKITSLKLEGQSFGYSDISEMGYGEMELRATDEYLYFKEKANGIEVPYEYETNDDGTGKIWNQAESYDIYYTDDTITIDFASSPDFSEYKEYTMDFELQ